MKILGRFEYQWYRETQERHFLPPLSRLWPLAQHQNHRRLRGALSDEELFGLFADTVLDCVERFNERHPPRQGVTRRRVEDRFTYYFCRKLTWKMKTIRLERRKRKGPEERDRYRGPEGDRYEYATQPKSRTALYRLLHEAVVGLGKADAQLVMSRHWHGLTWDELAAKCGFSSRFQAKRKLDQVYGRLRESLTASLGNVLVHAEDDFEPVRTFLAA